LLQRNQNPLNGQRTKNGWELLGDRPRQLLIT